MNNNILYSFVLVPPLLGLSDALCAPSPAEMNRQTERLVVSTKQVRYRFFDNPPTDNHTLHYDTLLPNTVIPVTQLFMIPP